ncbi:hypothetical protein Hdeb2414_s0001g00042281 [Helianthus debilis subsp. tardiflorus]
MSVIRLNTYDSGKREHRRQGIFRRLSKILIGCLGLRFRATCSITIDRDGIQVTDLLQCTNECDTTKPTIPAKENNGDKGSSDD